MKPEEETEIKIALCPKCKKVIFAGVLHLMDKDGKKELADLVVDGCDVKTIPLLEYRKSKIGWCDNPEKHLITWNQKNY